MTPEELDEARAIEAQRRWATSEQTGSSSWATAARLAREGWTPPPPVDPEVLAVRGVLALMTNSESTSNGYREGKFDNDGSFQLALAAYKAGKEAAR